MGYVFFFGLMRARCVLRGWARGEEEEEEAEGGRGGGICMYMYIYGKEKCNQCNILKNLLDEKGIQYHYLDVSKIPHELLTYLRMYCNTYPIVLGVQHFSTFNETLDYFNDI